MRSAYISAALICVSWLPLPKTVAFIITVPSTSAVAEGPRRRHVTSSDSARDFNSNRLYAPPRRAACSMLSGDANPGEGKFVRMGGTDDTSRFGPR